jgi:hypothetical protein
MKQIFISYVEEDSDVVRAIAAGLEQAGFSTWYFERDSIPGADYLWQTGENIEQALVFLLLISPASIGSRQVTSEVVRAHECAKPFLPVLRDFTHAEFQQRQPVWRQAVGAAASVRIPAKGVSAILSNLIAGVRNLGLQPARPSTAIPMPPTEAAAATMASPRARCLQDLALDVRNRTIQLLQATDPAELTWTPHGTANHILWHAGHALWVGDVLCIKLVTGSSELPPGWDEMFKMGSRPASWTKPWPARDELLGQLRAQLPRLRQTIGSLRDTQLDRQPPFPHRGDPRTLGESILHGLHDEANHQGEMYLLLKMQRLGFGQEAANPGHAKSKRNPR